MLPRVPRMPRNTSQRMLERRAFRGSILAECDHSARDRHGGTDGGPQARTGKSAEQNLQLVSGLHNSTH